MVQLPRGQRRREDPDPEIRQKMWLLAQALSAKVQGDDGEFYNGLAGDRVGCRPRGRHRSTRALSLAPDILEPRSMLAYSSC